MVRDTSQRRGNPTRRRWLRVVSLPTHPLASGSNEGTRCKSGTGPSITQGTITGAQLLRVREHSPDSYLILLEQIQYGRTGLLIDTDEEYTYFMNEMSRLPEWSGTGEGQHK